MSHTINFEITSISTDSKQRLHNPLGAAVLFKNKLEYFAWHGIKCKDLDHVHKLQNLWEKEACINDSPEALELFIKKVEND